MLTSGVMPTLVVAGSAFRSGTVNFDSFTGAKDYAKRDLEDKLFARFLISIRV
jgi:hypothetical protein